MAPIAKAPGTTASPSADFDRLLEGYAGRDTLRFITCGSVDDGKSTLIGRLLHDAQLIHEDQLAAMARDSRARGAGRPLDLSLLVDGLEAEREQGITIDVAWRFFATARRSFVVADTPGHDQYTRNMATGASTAELAVLLVDARAGLLPQTRRHAAIAALFGVRHMVLAVNKMDLVGWEQDRFASIAGDFARLAGEIGIPAVTAIPLSALDGDNVFRRGDRAPWYGGPTLIEHLETVAVTRATVQGPFRLPVQWVGRTDTGIRFYAGTVVSGRIRTGEALAVGPGGGGAAVAGILGSAGEQAEAVAGQAVALTLDREIALGRGDVLAAASDPVAAADQFSARLVWMARTPLFPGRPYVLKLATAEVAATVTELKYRLNVTSQEHEAAKTLALNDIGTVNIATDRPVAFAPYEENRDLGGFILIDRTTGDTVAAGTILFALRRAANLFWQVLDVDRAARARAKDQRPRVVWFTGLSGSGKSTIANLVDRKLHASGRHTFVLDGDNVRHGLNRDLGFTAADRVENIRRVAEVARLMADAGLIVLVSFISPYEAERKLARDLLPEGEFVEVFVDTPLAECERRDPKGLYARARAGQLANFTGIDSAYEPPAAPDIHLRTVNDTPEHLADQVIAFLERG